MKRSFAIRYSKKTTLLLYFGSDPFNQNYRTFRSKTEMDRHGSIQPDTFRNSWSTDGFHIAEMQLLWIVNNGKYRDGLFKITRY